MESSLKNEVKVGIFIILGIVGFCISVLLLGGDQMFFKARYQLKVKLPQVQGLGPGSIVSLAGVPVGNINEVLFQNGNDGIEVVMDVDESVKHRITEGTMASVKTQGALGDKYIYLTPGPLNAPALAENSYVSADAGGDLIDMITAKGAELAQVVEVIKEVKTLLHSINEGNRTSQLMSNLVSTTDNLNKLMVDSRKAMTHFESVAQKIDKGQGTLGALINDPTLHNRIMSMVGDTPRNKFLKPIIRDTIESHEKASQGK